MATPFEPRSEGPSGTPEWLRYGASSRSSSSSADELDISPWPPVVPPRRKRKEVMVVPPHVARQAGSSGGFMADAWRAWYPGGGTGRVPPLPPPAVFSALAPEVAPSYPPADDRDDGWEEVCRHLRTRRDDHLARPPSHTVPGDLVGRCFNYLETGHVAAACRNPSRCLHCKREGHQSHFCRRGRVSLAPSTSVVPHCLSGMWQATGRARQALTPHVLAAPAPQVAWGLRKRSALRLCLL